MPRSCQRKLTDLTSGEDLAQLLERLQIAKIPAAFHIHATREVDFYRVLVPSWHLQKAREILAEKSA